MTNPIILLKENINTQVFSSETVGKIKREALRKRNKNKIIKEGLAIFEKYFPKAFLPVPELPLFETRWPLFVQELYQYFSSQNRIVIAHNAIAKAIDEGTKAKLWNAAISTHLIQLKRDRPFKSLTFFKQVKILYDFERKWLENIYKQKNITENEQLTNCLISAICHSGLNEFHHVNALLQTLQKKKPLKLKDNIVYLDLTLIPEELNQKFPFSTNCYLEKETDTPPVLITRFFPTSITLGFIYHYLNKRTNKEQLTSAHAWKIILIKVKALTNEDMSRKGFCQAGIGIAEAKPNVTISEALVEYSTKRNMSYSLPPENWQTIGSQYQVQQVKKLPSVSSSTTKIIKISTHKNTSFGLINDLKKALRKKDKDRVRTPAIALKAINKCFDLSDTTKPLNERILVSWLVSLLEKKKTTSTLTRYFSAIGALWITNTSAIDIEKTPEYFDALYTGMLELTASNTEKDYKTKLLIRLHRFAVQHFDVPPVIDFSFSTNRSIAHVRASFIPESAFASLLQSINLCEHVNSKEKALLTIIFIFAYRTGLRLGEILKLKVSDIEWSPQCWLFIRDNEYDQNKSNAARRKIPLVCLLTTNELALLKKFIRNAAIPKKRKKSPNTLLFSTTINHNVLLKKSSISLFFNQLVKQVTELDLFVFHSFRHTTLSRLQLIIHYQNFNLGKKLNTLKTELLPYTNEQIINITETAFGHSTRGKYWALCTFAGHRSPQTTFNSYLHFCDLLTFYALDMNQQLFSKEDIWHITKLSRSKIAALFSKNNNTNKTTIEVSQIMPLLVKQISKKSYCHVVTLPHINKQKLPTQEIAPQKDNSNNFEKVYEILHRLELGESIEQDLWLYNVSHKQVTEWVQKAKIINKISTNKHHSRNISQHKKQGLIATIPKNKEDTNEITNLVNFLRNKLKNIHTIERDRQFIKIIKIVLCRTNTSNSAIIFRHYSYLESFLQFFSFFPKKRWYVKIYCNNKGNLKLWKQALRGYPSIKEYQLDIQSNFTQDARNPYGKVELYLLSHSDKQVARKNNWQKYSTNMLKFTINILAIIWMDKDKLKQLIELA